MSQKRERRAVTLYKNAIQNVFKFFVTKVAKDVFFERDGKGQTVGGLATPAVGDDTSHKS
jgi:hypothetical protein